MGNFNKILIGVPCYSGKMAVETVSSIANAIRYHTYMAPEDKVVLRFRVRNFTTYAAERLCEEAASHYDYLLFWGDDMVAEPDIITKLVRFDKDIVLPSFFARSDPYAFYAFDDDLHHLGLDRLKTGLQKVRAAGTGIMLIKSEVLKKMKRPWWFWPNDDSTDCDKEFCLRAGTEAGAEIWVDTDTVVAHLDFTPRGITNETHLAWLKSVLQSGVLNNKEVREHHEFAKMEALINGSKRVLELKE